MTAAQTRAARAYLDRWAAHHHLTPTDHPQAHTSQGVPRFPALGPLPVATLGDALANNPTDYTFFWHRQTPDCYEHPQVGLVVTYGILPDPNYGLPEQTAVFAEVAARLQVAMAVSTIGHGPHATAQSIRTAEPSAQVTFAFVIPDPATGASLTDAQALADALVAPFDPLLAEVPVPALRTRFTGEDLFPFADPHATPAPDWLLRLRREAAAAVRKATAAQQRTQAQATGDRKTCTRCGQAKPVGQFYARTDSRDGSQAVCKACDDTRTGQPSAADARKARSRIHHQALAELMRRHRAEFEAIKAQIRADQTDDPGE